MAKKIFGITAIVASVLATIAATRIAPLAVAAAPEGSNGQQQQQKKKKKRQKQPEAYQERLVDWILEDPSGFFHPSILFKRLGSDEETGPYAMHATEDIPKGTPLIVLPRKYVLESGIPHPEDEEHTEWDPRMCRTVGKMLTEYRDHTDPDKAFQSFYAPYLSYLFDETVGGTTRGLLPTSWSEPALKILHLIVERFEDGSYTLEPDDFEHWSIFDICSGNWWEENPNPIPSEENSQQSDMGMESFVEQHAEDAYLFLLSRGWFDKLLPLLDFVNHQNGPARNVEITAMYDFVDDENGVDNDVALYAWKDVARGEQLLYSYSECMDETCDFGRIRYSFTTPQVLVDYGFVEFYPQRWAFYIGADKEEEEDKDVNVKEEKELKVEVTTDPNDDTKLVARWIFNTPNERDILWIRNQLARLKSIESSVREGVSELESSVLLWEGTESTTTIHNIAHERDTILEFYESFVRVFELALEHKDDPVAVTKESHEKDMRELMELGLPTTIDELRKHEVLLSSDRSHKDDEEETSVGTESKLSGAEL